MRCAQTRHGARSARTARTSDAGPRILRAGPRRLPRGRAGGPRQGTCAHWPASAFFALTTATRCLKRATHCFRVLPAGCMRAGKWSPGQPVGHHGTLPGARAGGRRTRHALGDSRPSQLVRLGHLHERLLECLLLLGRPLLLAAARLRRRGGGAGLAVVRGWPLRGDALGRLYRRLGSRCRGGQLPRRPRSACGRVGVGRGRRLGHRRCAGRAGGPGPAGHGCSRGLALLFDLRRTPPHARGGGKGTSSATGSRATAFCARTHLSGYMRLGEVAVAHGFVDKVRHLGPARGHADGELDAPLFQQLKLAL